MREIPSFDAALVAAGNSFAGAEPDEDRAFAVPIRPPLAPLAEEASPAGAGAYLWDQASAWVPEPEPPEPPPAPPPPPPPPPPPSGDPADIARELALSDAASAEDWNRLRRRFCWENHPDRHPDWPDRLANRRVAIANMLIDRALDELARPRRVK